MTVRAFLLNHLRAASEYYDVSVITNTNAPDFLKNEFQIDVEVLPVLIKRSISPWHDFMALLTLWRIFRQERFSLVHSVTPKAGLLAAIAGCLARVPHRWHTFTGQVWATRTGLSRFFLKQMDCLNVGCITRSMVDSQSQLDFLLAEGVASPGQSQVLAEGSISGVDVSRFKLEPSARQEINKRYGVSGDALLCLYLGRLKKDKGVKVLAEAFSRVHEKLPNTVLMCIGPDEEFLESELKEIAGSAADSMHFIPFTKTPEHYLAAADLFCLPSYREGFGSVVIEAAACGIPSVGANIYGISDAIKDGETGLLVRPGSVDELAAAMTQLLTDEVKRKSMGTRARERVHNQFTSDIVTNALMSEYKKVLI